MWGSDSRHLVFFDADNSVRVARLEEKAPGTQLDGHQGAVIAVQWSHDARRLATASRTDQTVRVWAPPASATRVLLAGHDFVSVDWSPDDSRVAVIDMAGELRVVEVESGASVSLGTHTTHAGGGGGMQTDFKKEDLQVAWSPANPALLASLERVGGLLILWDLAAEPRTQAFPLSPSPSTITICSGPSWSSTYVAVTCLEVAEASGGARSSDVVVVLVHALDRTVQRLSHGQHVANRQSTSLAFSPDGSALAVAGAEHVGVWEQGSGGEWRFRMLGDVGKVVDVAWSQDARSLFLVEQSGRVEAPPLPAPLALRTRGAVLSEAVAGGRWWRWRPALRAADRSLPPAPLLPLTRLVALRGECVTPACHRLRAPRRHPPPVHSPARGRGRGGGTAGGRHRRREHPLGGGQGRAQRRGAGQSCPRCTGLSAGRGAAVCGVRC